MIARVRFDLSFFVALYKFRKYKIYIVYYSVLARINYVLFPFQQQARVAR